MQSQRPDPGSFALDDVYQDYRDIVIATLRGDLLRLEARVEDLQGDVGIWREMAKDTIHALHHVTSQRDRLRAENRELRDRLQPEGR